MPRDEADAGHGRTTDWSAEKVSSRPCSGWFGFDRHLVGIERAVIADFDHLVERLLIGPHRILACFRGRQHAPIARIALVWAMSRRFRLAKLVEIDVFEWNVEGRGVGGFDMRSASRYDLGDNAARIVDFLAELDQEVAGQVGTAPAE
ncbi:hypothetical protein MES5069_520151 [Mesorhizobium escarrei]|uniref:DUF5655 domain-containing protein n=1 Tax=Mesorhizobium escarrei TaxID=666018 RepID=A0ABN8K872_9HYPH|nr:hypothetical protein MES5069_520151 [Mesorhizobium escarrei]